MNPMTRTSKPFKKETLAERVAASIEEAIVAGEYRGGEMLPTEPEMSDQFGVSRAVVRDATRMLAAKGLIEVRQGKGSFVTKSQTEAFGEALLLALRRMDATNWDVAQFEQILFPEIAALAAQHATEMDLANIESAAEKYLDMHARIAGKGLPEEPSAEHASFRRTWSHFVQAVFDATHNKLISLLSQPLIRLHGTRDWQGLPEPITHQEARFVESVIGLIRSGDPDLARSRMQALMDLPPEAVSALRETEVAEAATIVLPD